MALIDATKNIRIINVDQVEEKTHTHTHTHNYRKSLETFSQKKRRTLRETYPK